MNDNDYTGPRDPINCPYNQEDPRLYEIAKQVTFEAGFPTWTDPRTGKVYRNPMHDKRKRFFAKHRKIQQKKGGK